MLWGRSQLLMTARNVQLLLGYNDRTGHLGIDASKLSEVEPQRLGLERLPQRVLDSQRLQEEHRSLQKDWLPVQELPLLREVQLHVGAAVAL